MVVPKLTPNTTDETTHAKRQSKHAKRQNANCSCKLQTSAASCKPRGRLRPMIMGQGPTAPRAAV
eukprot:1910605-Prymnesium_polylepis.1